ncbi:MarR family winged helix-turn-helix transcriptional regulator [Amorphus sp. 3PC139-8]|uniref:MarR family winged helix-turn-helix transcriptional regulator n=1 Tax=Amorphus sp. 3PC139-8 TaxID=2735676 RepID=UPI00345C6E19
MEATLSQTRNKGNHQTDARRRTTTTGSAERGLGASLRMAHRFYTRRLQGHLAKRGLTLAQYLHMRVLYEEGALYQTEISSLLGIEKASSTSVLDNLDRSGLIERRRDPSDRRRLAVSLSEKGRLQTVDLLHFAREVAQDAISGVDDSDREAFFRVIDRIVANLAPLPSDD